MSTKKCQKKQNIAQSLPHPPPIEGCGSGGGGGKKQGLGKVGLKYKIVFEVMPPNY
jgi:hypothetical protein